jgi:hypothetical protein
MIARIKQRLPLALSILAVTLVSVPAFAHGDEHAKFAHNADKLDGKSSGDFYAQGSKVADANKLDGINSTGFYAAGSKVRNAEKLDGSDSSVFRTSVMHARVKASDCDSATASNFCAPITIVVPSGKSYRVSVWSSGSWKATTSSTISYCSARFEPESFQVPSCITPFGFGDHITLSSGQSLSGSSLGETEFGEGTYQVGMIVVPSAEMADEEGNQVITKVLVRDTDAEASGCPGGATLC